MTKPIIRIHDITKDKIIDREMNDKEFTAYQNRIEKQEIAQAEAEAKTAQRQLILDKLGLTADEARLLLG